MQKRPLAQGALSLSPVVFGAMWRRLQGETEARGRIVREALEFGISSIDTAPLYDFGGSEEVLGRAIKGIRNQVELLTKVGLRWDSDHGETLFSATISGARRAVKRDSRPSSIRRDVEESLSRLRTDVLDLVQVHHRDRDTPISETIGELLRLRGEGKLRTIGVSNFKAEEIRETARELGQTPLASTQDPYSLIERGLEVDTLPAARELGVGVLCYAPLERGLLAGCLLDKPASEWPRRGPLFAPRNARVVHQAIERCLAPVAERHEVSLASIAMAWLLAEPGVSGVICGASSRQQLEQNARSASVTLSEEERDSLREGFGALRLNPKADRGLASRARAWLRRGAKRALGRG